MDYPVFIQVIKEAVQKKIGEDGFVSFHPVMKNNQNCIEALVIRKGAGNVFPAIYMPPLYQAYKNGTPVEVIADRVIGFNSRYDTDTKHDLSFYCNYDLVRERVSFRLVNYDLNSDMLEHVPHKKFLDLAVIYYYRLEDNDFNDASILIKSEHLQMWGIDHETLHKDAMDNTIQMTPYDFISIKSLLQSIGIPVTPDFEKEIEFYILTNTEKSFGAASLYYPSVQEEISEKLHGDYYVLPSSIHECMVVPYSKELDPYEMQKIVREVNKEDVAEEDILGYNVYLYCQAQNKLDIITA